MEKLQEDWSPEAIAGRLPREFPDDLRMRISHETIYRFVASRTGQLLALPGHLRRGKARVPRRARTHSQDLVIPARVSIRVRPPVVETRARFGDWESDSMQGQRRGAALSVQREQQERRPAADEVPDLTSAATTHALLGVLRRLPPSLRRTMTFDNGRENVGHVRLSTLDVRTFFCDPYCPWQKGVVEHDIDLIRQYCPKGMPLELVSDADVARSRRG